MKKQIITLMVLSTNRNDPVADHNSLLFFKGGYENLAKAEEDLRAKIEHYAKVGNSQNVSLEESDDSFIVGKRKPPHDRGNCTQGFVLAFPHKDQLYSFYVNVFEVDL